MSYEEFLALKETEPARFKRYRQRAKIVNFGLGGGLGGAPMGMEAGGMEGEGGLGAEGGGMGAEAGAAGGAEAPPPEEPA